MMNPYQIGDRVMLLRDHAGVPAGSVGTVRAVAPASCRVAFDVDPTTFVQVPVSLLASAPARSVAAKLSTFTVASTGALENVTLDASFHWFPPDTVPVNVGTSANFIAVTETKDTLSLLFERVGVELRCLSRSGVWSGATEFPVEGAPRTLSGELRLFVDQGEGGVVTVALIAGGTVASQTYRDAPGDTTIDLKIEVAPRTVVVPITLIVVAERQSLDSDSVVMIEGLDLVAGSIS